MKIKIVSAAPTWMSALPVYTGGVKSKKQSEQFLAYTELGRMAQAADLFNEFAELLQRGEECGIFEDAPEFRKDVRKLLRKARGVAK